MYETGEVFYRTMSKEHDEELLKTNRMLGTGETTTSPTLRYIKLKEYDGVIIKFQMQKSTLDELVNIGIRNYATREMMRCFPKMKSVKYIKYWMETNALFKTEGAQLKIPQINIGLGRGKALKIFNNNIINFEIVK